jgi:putative membrane protein
MANLTGQEAVMHKLIVPALLVSISSLTLAQVNTGQRQEEPIRQAAQQGIAKMMLTNETFVKKAALSNLAEVELSNLVLRKNGNPTIQSFAQRMLKDHTAATKELQAIAKSKSFEVPVELDDAHRRAYEKLSNASGSEFDKEYTRQMQEDHNDAVNLFSAAAEDKNLDPMLQQFAAKTLPILKDHQKAAHDLLGNKHAGQ